MTRLFIENSELDIDKGLSNQITYAIDDLNNLDSKTTAFSKTIVIPGTTKNNNLLGNILSLITATLRTMLYQMLNTTSMPADRRNAGLMLMVCRL